MYGFQWILRGVVFLVVLIIIFLLCMVLKITGVGSITEENSDDNRNELADQLEMRQLGENWRFYSPPPPCSLHSNPCHVSAHQN